MDGLAKYEKVRLSQLEKKAVKKPAPSSATEDNPAQQQQQQPEAATLQQTLTDANGTAEHPSPGRDAPEVRLSPKASASPAAPKAEEKTDTKQINGNHVAALTGWTRPPCLDPIIQTSCRTLFEETCFLRGITDHDTKAQIWSERILKPRGFAYESEVTPSAWSDIERELVQKIDAIYVERGTPEASPFHATFRA